MDHAKRMNLYDAHNHLQDDRLKPWREQLVAKAAEAGVVRMVVNGSCEEDWPAVAALAKQNPQVIPSFGYHPWYVHERTSEWQRRLVEFLDQTPSAIGEIGLDRWILQKRASGVSPENQFSQNSKQVKCRRDIVSTFVPQAVGHDANHSGKASFEEQQEVFVWQLRLAARRNLPVSIHCLQAWGALHDILRHEPLPACGFLLHSYGGPVEMVKPLADLGAYFSLPGYYAHERKQRQRETFKQVPPDRLLIETDAPDQCLPDELNLFPLKDEPSGRPLNHPANLSAVYRFAAGLLGRPVEELAAQVEGNFFKLFGPVNLHP